jgi:hypothetical protein
MPAASERSRRLEADLEFVADQAIEACGGDAQEAVKALLVARLPRGPSRRTAGGDIKGIFARAPRRATRS